MDASCLDPWTCVCCASQLALPPQWQGCSTVVELWLPYPPSCMSTKLFCFSPGQPLAEGHRGYLSVVFSVVREGFFHNLIICLLYAVPLK